MLEFKPVRGDASAEFYFSDTFQQSLARWNRQRLEPGFPGDDWREKLADDTRMQLLEGEFLEDLRASVKEEAGKAPQDVDGFIAWFEGLKEVGPGQNDPLFPWLAEHASRDELRWFFEQEAAGEAGFDDLVAMTQIKLPDQAKLELARNYWDEMGRGNAKGMHGPMLHIVAEALEVNPAIETTVAESLALANAMTGMATSRRYAWHSVGALGVIELTAPGRSALVAKGLRRIGLSGRERRYFDLHAVLDVKHSEDWNREALIPLVKEDPRRAIAIAEGALMRLACGQRCFERYRAHLWDESAVAVPLAPAA
ncbi:MULTISPECIES: iron-containing redox enzyme family protein [Novosphingobium]|uniref:Iron-containing redox enzyme n=1 Tax=Novosphingobium panipatense TaxID=428991 RepID=A0ABY1QXZ4_9SPHN|nr:MULTISPECIES: iron-containing redox enzyme family protein [Novosphingobium]SMP81896.1 Iron-containing redox enzyme [Novosphingobium panipatense]